MEYKANDLSQKTLFGNIDPADEGAGFFTIKEAKIGRRHVWLYKMQTPIGDFFVTEAEQPGMELKSWVFHYDAEKAVRRFDTCVKRILNGKAV